MSEARDIEAQQDGQPNGRKGYGFGTFKGVYTPSILTILGVVMYLRFGWVLGNVGLWLTLLIVTMASSITFLTGLALAALATNMKVGGGGAYYIISRSLGVEAGAAIGVPLFFAQTLSIAFYVCGFSEAFIETVPQVEHIHFLGLSSFEIVAVATLVILTVVAYFSADLALKTQLVIMVFILISLVSFFLGGKPTGSFVTGDAPPRESFWIVFAVFFPAVAGIEAGIAMSGDLKKPARSLPLGTIGAVLTGYVIYVAIPIFLSCTIADKDMLRIPENNVIMRHVARWGWCILLGVWAASLSSAMGSLLGAPRTLQALARDRVVPKVIGRGFGKGNDPRIATAIAFAVALSALLMGGLNVIAPILTMFFLTSYGLLNVSAGLEELIRSPSWRPKFRVPALVSLAGAFACFAAMFMINAGATLMAGAVAVGIYYMMERRKLNVQWGDMKYGILMLVARSAIRRLASRKPDERTWKPNILALSGSPKARWHLVELAHAMSQGDSCLTLATIVPTGSWSFDREESIAKSIRSYLAKHDIQALIKVFPSDDLVSGASALVKAYGFGPIAPNTILLGETEKAESFEDFASLIQLVYRSRRNLILVRGGKETTTGGKSRIDVWIRGEANNVGLLLTLAFLLRRSAGWENASLNLKMIVDSDSGMEEARRGLVAMVEQVRLKAETDVILKTHDNVFDTIRESSRGADLVFLGMRPPAGDESASRYSLYYKTLLSNTEGLPATVMALSAEKIEFRRIMGPSE